MIGTGHAGRPASRSSDRKAADRSAASGRTRRRLPTRRARESARRWRSGRPTTASRLRKAQRTVSRSTETRWARSVRRPRWTAPGSRRQRWADGGSRGSRRPPWTGKGPVVCGDQVGPQRVEGRPPPLRDPLPCDAHPFGLVTRAGSARVVTGTANRSRSGAGRRARRAATSADASSPRRKTRPEKLTARPRSMTSRA